MHKYKDLKIGTKSVELAKEVYLLTEKFPKHQQYSLTQQMQRSAVSISSNIAEGAGRNSQKEFLQFLSIAQGSCYELESQLTIALELKSVDEHNASEIFVLIEEVQKMNYALQGSIKSKI